MHNNVLCIVCVRSEETLFSAVVLLRPVTEWFDEEGTLVFDRFKTDFNNLCCDAKSSDKTQ